MKKTKAKTRTRTRHNVPTKEVLLFGLRVQFAQNENFDDHMKIIAEKTGLQELSALPLAERIESLEELCYEVNCESGTRNDELAIAPLTITIGLTLIELFNGKWVIANEAPCVQVGPSVIFNPRVMVQKINEREFTFENYLKVIETVCDFSETAKQTILI
jgi:hypothetical protein